MVKLASEHVPQDDSDAAPKNKKRKSGTVAEANHKKKKPQIDKQKNANMTLGEREKHALRALEDFIEQKGGSRDSVKNFKCRVIRKPSDGRYDTKYYNEEGKPFRSMMEVGRYLNLIAELAPAKKKLAFVKRKATTREIEAEKKRIRKELDKLRKQHTRAVKNLNDFTSDDKESRYPVEDSILQEEEESKHSGNAAKVSPETCAGARRPDVLGFPTVPQHCIPDLLMAWDFMSTFSRVVAVNPIGLDDFVQALTYQPPGKLAETDAFSNPPVYIAEAHIGLLKLLISDPSSDEWWWSILETDETENMRIDLGDAIGKEDYVLPLIKVDFAALLAEPEDPLMTTSWLQNLEDVRKLNPSNPDAIKNSIRTAIAVVGNKYVRAYLRKALRLGKTSGASSMQRAVVWLHDKVQEARPDLNGRSVSKTALFKQRAKMVEEVSQQMEKLSNVALAVGDEDLASDVESDDESDDSDDDEEEAVKPTVPELAPQVEAGDLPASVLPPKPPPTLVDLLLPPAKPPLEILNANSWSHIAGAAACRILHRFKRLRNEVDDSLRNSKELPRLTVTERRQRETFSTSRVFSESCVNIEVDSVSEKAVNHLCSGGHYLQLSPQQRICILRILVEAAYDTARVYELVDSNHKQRVSATKALDAEQKRARRDAKEKSAADEAAARNDLALELQRKFIEEKREEIRKANNEGSKELTNDEIDALTDEEIIEFDEDFKADFDALPAAESFKKAEVMERVAKIQEAAAFETSYLHVVTMEELVQREERDLEAMKETLHSLGGENSLLDPTVDRDTSRTIERLRRDIEKAIVAVDTLPSQREQAVEALREANADGTIKALRNAIRIAKSAKLFGTDSEGNGMWALDVVRDAHMELHNAKQLKRVADAQKELISKLNRCFIRTEPLGYDRFGNRFWHFEQSERGHIWAEVDYLVKVSDAVAKISPEYLDLKSSVEAIAIGASDVEGDLAPVDANETLESFLRFSRLEYHASGLLSCLAKRCWGSHVTEASLRSVIKTLDSRGVRENQLKKNLKEAVEDNGTTQYGPSDQPAGTEEPTKSESTEEENAEDDILAESGVETSGDESAFREAKELALSSPSDMLKMESIEHLSTGIGASVRVRILLESSKDGEVARYENGSISGWKMRKESKQIQPGDNQSEPETIEISTAVWRATTDRGREFWVGAIELIDSISRHSRWLKKETSYFENDASFLSYRNSLGRHCGRAAEAAHAATPIRFAQSMVKKEAELYTKLKHRNYDNSWGGKSAPRNAWISSMKDYAFDFDTAKEGLLTLEGAFVELSGTFGGENGDGDGDARSGKDILEDTVARNDIELESIERVSGIWNSKASRAVFLEIVKSECSIYTRYVTSRNMILSHLCSSLQQARRLVFFHLRWTFCIEIREYTSQTITF